VTMLESTERITRWRHESDRTIALTGIENKAQWVKADAVDLAHYVGMLESLPAYETNAEDMVNQAELALTEALLSVKLSKSALDKKRNSKQEQNHEHQ